MKKRAFTIIEVLVAIFILEIGIMGVGSFFTYSFKIIRVAREETIASNLASGLLDEEIANSFDNLLPVAGTRSKYSTDQADPFYNWDKKIDITFLDTNLNETATPTEMKKIIVTIFWKSAGSDKTFQTATIKAKH